MVRVFAAAGFLVSAYLLYLKLSGQISSVVGCGQGSGCENVLGSRWSQWFGIPVSALSAVFYAGLLAMTYKPTKSVMTMAALVLVGVAAWFMGLQVFIIKEFCPWCFATHCIGLVTAGAILVAGWFAFRPVYFAAPIFVLAGLGAGQVFGPQPDTHELSDGGGFENQSVDEVDKAPKGRVIEFTGKTFELGKVPLIGSPEATHVLVKYFDYTCKSCLSMEGDLEVLMKKYPGEVAVIVLPTPLNRACNPYFNRRDHAHACELARLGLAIWKAKPEVFEKAHRILFSRPVMDEASAKAKLAEVISPEELAAGLADPYVDQMLKANSEDFRLLTQKKMAMPKLLIKDGKIMQGVARTPEIFVTTISQELQLE